MKLLFAAASRPFRRPLFGLSAFSAVVIGFGFVKFILHMATAQSGGYYADELYAMDMSRHLALGYVDLPPLVPALIAMVRSAFGESLFAIRLLPALAGSVTLALICLTTREFGGRLFATAVSALCCLMSVYWLCMNSYFGYDSFDQLWSVLFLYLLVRFLRTGNPKLWIGLGAAAALAVMSKTTILYYGPGFLAALWISRYRRHLLTRWPWLGAGLFLAIAAPYIAWEFVNQWPSLEYWRNYSASLYPASAGEYLLAVIVSVNPAAFPIIAAGLGRIFRRFEGVDYSFIGILFLITAGLLFAVHARYHMVAALFAPLIAAGSVYLEELLSGIKWKQWIQAPVLAGMTAGLIVAAPSGLSLLSPDQMRQYDKVFGFFYTAVKFDNNPPPEFPLVYGYRHGWDNLVETVADVYHGLPPDERGKVGGVLTDWFGPAGAINLLGPKYGLPRALSGHLNYHLWGPGGSSWEVMIVLSWFKGRYEAIFDDCREAGSVSADGAGPGINNLPVYICRNPKMPVEEMWAFLKNYS